MKFKLTLMQNGEKKIWTFDNVTNFFFDENGKQLLTEYKNNGWIQVKPFTPSNNPHKKSNNLELIEIVLGLRCNFDCLYCAQRSIRNKGYDGTPKDVIPFIEKLKKANIRCSQFQFWGGEPLVYWKTLKLLIPELRKLYPKAIFYFPTNGSLLTKEIVDFCKQYDVRFSISHDGCNDENRLDDVLKDEKVIETVKYAIKTLPDGYFSFGATLQKDNLNPQNIYNFFKEKIDKKVFVGTHNVVRCSDSKDEQTKPFCYIPKEQLKQYSDNIFNLLNDPELSQREFSNSYIRDVLIRGWMYKEPITAITAECSHPFSSSIACNLKGDVLQCHSYNPHISYGNIENLQEVEIKNYTHFSKRKLTNCKNCIVVHSCKGGCPSADEEASKLSCPNLKAQHWGIFRAAMAGLFGVYVLDYEPIIE